MRIDMHAQGRKAHTITNVPSGNVYRQHLYIGVALRAVRCTFRDSVLRIELLQRLMSAKTDHVRRWLSPVTILDHCLRILSSSIEHSVDGVGH